MLFFEKQFLKFERLLETYLAFAPRGITSFSKSMPLWIKDKLFQKSLLIRELEQVFTNTVKWREKILFSEHHLSHAASAFYPSPFKKAAVLSLDGVGEWSSITGIGKWKDLEIVKEINFPHSLDFYTLLLLTILGLK